MDFLRGQGRPGEEWKPTAEKRLDLAALSPPAAGARAAPPTRAASPIRLAAPAPTPTRAAVPTRLAAPAPTHAAVPARAAAPVVWEWIEPRVLVALGVALAALLVLLAVGWLFL
jgi:hypothetical protein